MYYDYNIFHIFKILTVICVLATYTYTMKLVLDKFRKDPIKYSTQLDDPSSNQYQKLTEATKEGLNRMSMQSDLRDIYHGVIVGGFEPDGKSDKAVVSYIIQVIFYL